MILQKRYYSIVDPAPLATLKGAALEFITEGDGDFDHNI